MMFRVCGAIVGTDGFKNKLVAFFKFQGGVRCEMLVGRLR